MEVDHISKGKDNAKGKNKEAKTTPNVKAKSATCAERKGTSHETGGHESTKTKQRRSKRVCVHD